MSPLANVTTQAMEKKQANHELYEYDLGSLNSRILMYFDSVWNAPAGVVAGPAGQRKSKSSR